MSNRILAGLTLTGVVILASCGQDITPTTSVPAAPSFARAPSCSFSTTNNDAKAYFASVKDPAFALIDAMNTAYKAGGAAAAVAPGFDVLARIGVAANNGASQVKGSPAQGNTLVNDLLICMDGYPTNINFTSALGPTGLFGVRVGGTTTAVVARSLSTSGVPTTGPAPLGAPLYGAEPYTAGYPSTPPAAAIPTPTWPYSGPALFYGSSLGQSSIAGQTAAGVLFDLKTLPVVTFSSPIRAGVCDVSNQNARTLHRHVVDPTTTTTVIVPPAGVPIFCSAPPALTASRGSFTQMLASLFAPKPLYAFAFGGGGAGLVGNLSEIGPVLFTDVLTFQGNIPNASVSDTTLSQDLVSPGVFNTTTSQFSSVITVKAVSAGGNIPLAGVTLTLSIYNNNGSYVPAPPANSQAVTDDKGIATFPNYFIDKAGGYLVLVTSEFGTTKLSNPFNIDGH